MRLASSTSGTTPAAMTTRSAAIVSPSCSSTRSSWIAVVMRSHRTSMPCSRSARSSIRAAVASSWRSISRAPRWTTVTAMPRLATARAASSPSSPPPITTARPRAVGAAADGADVVAGAERDRPLDALDRRQERARAGRQDERVVADRAGVRGRHAVAGVGDPAAARDAVLAVPALVVQREVGRLAVPGEVIGEPDAVVRAAPAPRPASVIAKSPCSSRCSAVATPAGPEPTMRTGGRVGSACDAP